MYGNNKLVINHDLYSKHCCIIYTVWWVINKLVKPGYHRARVLQGWLLATAETTVPAPHRLCTWCGVGVGEGQQQGQHDQHHQDDHGAPAVDCVAFYQLLPATDMHGNREGQVRCVGGNGCSINHCTVFYFK